ncbi:MAG: DUF2851 family protein [Bacteroidales bacterium]|jgi:hypothetical protein|nr:DUF2851 family protein [Bacteroidales bacterium]
MKEEFLHYLWKYKLFHTSNLRTQTREKVDIIHPGIHNKDSGPDFFNARIKIGPTTWAGNVEIHLRSSDWYHHNHHLDKAYDNVILQVVQHHDQEVYLTNHTLVPTLEIRFDEVLLKNYEQLLESESWVACEKDLNTVEDFVVQKWIEALAVERLEEKSLRIQAHLKQTQNNWEETFYQLMARNFGFKLNAGPFELLAKSLPLKVLAKHRDNLVQLEALLLGQAGFLEPEEGDEYYLTLKQEFNYLRHKFKLNPLEKHLWKFLRSRPGNFPTLRIAQFAMLIYRSNGLFSRMMGEKEVAPLRALLHALPSAYWNRHYQLNKLSADQPKPLGRMAVDNVLINTVVPFLFVYGKTTREEEYGYRAMALLSEIKPENNSVITRWGKLGMNPKSAFDTQALIHLKNKYCTFKNCLQCQIGNYIIKNSS